ncbi:outer membrane protein [Tabrizicola sp.]|uniref:outer membrane protein n=1 Tax=Tabrizicola sp. TaxID=2005166 RepID=UPI0035B05491
MKHTIMIAALAALAGPAVAGGIAEPVVEAPVEVAAAPAPGMDWTGFYVGLSAFQGKFSDDGGATDLDLDGFGVQAGYLRDFGSFVLGGELAQVSGDYETGGDFDATRLKLIGGYDAGRFLPYAFVGMSSYEINDLDLSDSVPIYGIGARFAISPRLVAGLEYLVQKKDDFDGDAGLDMDDSDLSLRLDYRF